MSHLKLATYASGTAGLTDLCALLYISQADPFPVTYLPYAENVGEDCYGRPVLLGLPTAHWHWDWLPQPDIDTLLGYEGHVYVRTETRTGTIRSHAIFDAYLTVTDIGEPILPAGGVAGVPQARGPIEVDLTSLIAV